MMFWLVLVMVILSALLVAVVVAALRGVYGHERTVREVRVAHPPSPATSTPDVNDFTSTDMESNVA